MKPSPERFLCIAFLIITLASDSFCSDSAFADERGCHSDSDCKNFGFAQCDEKTQKCVCDPGSKEDSKGICVHIMLNDKCTTDDDCKNVANAMCKETECDSKAACKVCSCKEGFEDKGTGTCTAVHLNDECTTDEDCKGISNAICKETECDSKAVCKACACKEGFVDQGNACKQIAEIGKACDATLADPCGLFASCSKGKCTCNPGYKQKDSKYDCKAGIHEVCISKSDCYDKYAVCKSISNTVPLLGCECPKEHPLDNDHCSAGTTAFSTFSIIGALMAMALKTLIS